MNKIQSQKKMKQLKTLNDISAHSRDFFLRTELTGEVKEK